MGQLIFGYSSATESLEVNYIRVRKPEGRVIDTPAANAQDFAPEILREAPTYTDYRQRHISVASLQPGDLLEYHVIIHVSTAMAPHEFWYEHSFSKEIAVREERLEIDIPCSHLWKACSRSNKQASRDLPSRTLISAAVGRHKSRRH